MHGPDEKPVSPAKRAAWPLKIVIVGVLVLFLIGLIVGVAPAIGIPLLPSTAWYVQARPFAIGLGVAQGVTLATLTWLGIRAQGEAIRLKIWLIPPFFLVLGFWLGVGLVYTGPAFIGAAGQKTVAHSYTIKEVLRSTDRRCPNAVRLAGVPPMFDRVCDVPHDMHAWLFSGMRLEIIGAGNALGLRPGKIRKLP